MKPWTTNVVRLGAELGPVPADDLLATPATVLASVAVERAHDEVDADPDVLAAVAALHRLLGRTPRPWCGPALDAALAGLDLTWGPAVAVRLAGAVAAGLAAGHLPPGRPWALHIEEPVGAGAPALAPVFDLLSGLLDGWDLTLAPPSVTTNLGSLHRFGAGYRFRDGRLATLPDLWIELEPRSPAPATDTDAEDPRHRRRDATTVLVRPAPPPAADPGPPPAGGLPPNPIPALTAAARWCFPDGEDLDEQRAHIAGLFDGSGFPAKEAGDVDGEPAPPPRGREGLWRREAADLALAAQPEEPAAWCRRALVEADHPAGSRARHARLVQAAADTAGAQDHLRRHARNLREGPRAAWALDVWAVADAALEAQLVADVMGAPTGCDRRELGLSLVARLEAAASGFRAFQSRQTAEDG